MRRFAWRLGFVLGLLVLIFTRSILVAALVLLLCRFGLPLLIPYWYFPRDFRERSRRAPSPWSPSAPSAGASTQRRTQHSGIEVRCRVVHERGQEWVSTSTGRAYDVTPSNSLPGAQPGDLGYIRFTSHGWHVEPHDSAKHAVPPDSTTPQRH